jgi:hypothetical protein
MLLPVAALAGLLAGLLSGGRVRHLLARRLRWPLVAVAALAVKTFGHRPGLATSPITPWLYTLSLAALVAWVLWQRRRFPGIWLVAAGMAVNLLVVVANGGRMPVRRVLAGHGLPQLLACGSWGQYLVAGPGTRLAWLGDAIHFPGVAGRLLPQAYSAGDLLVTAGLLVTLFLATRPAATAAGLPGDQRWPLGGHPAWAWAPASLPGLHPPTPPSPGQGRQRPPGVAMPPESPGIGLCWRIRCGQTGQGAPCAVSFHENHWRGSH